MGTKRGDAPLGKPGFCAAEVFVVMSAGAITSKIKHAIKLKTSPARLVQLLQLFVLACSQ